MTTVDAAIIKHITSSAGNSSTINEELILERCLPQTIAHRYDNENIVTITIGRHIVCGDCFRLYNSDKQDYETWVIIRSNMYSAERYDSEANAVIVKLENNYDGSFDATIYSDNRKLTFRSQDLHDFNTDIEGIYVVNRPNMKYLRTIFSFIHYFIN